MINHILSGKEIKDIVNGEFIKDSNFIFTDVSTDSRNILLTEIFIPLKGESFDGHNFIESILNKGIKGIITEVDFETNLDITIIKVKNTLKAYQKISSYFRNKLNPFIIGITGSSGKTSTKEIAYAIFSQFKNTYKSQANYNNEVGVPLNLLNISKNHQVAVIEMGMRGRNQIKELSEIAHPNAGIITGVGSAHIELLETVENISLAKWELADYLKLHNGYLAIPIYDKYLFSLSQNYPKNKLITIDLKVNEKADFYLIDSWIENGKQFFSYFNNKNKKKLRASLSVLGKHQISNALLCLSLSSCLNITLPEFLEIDIETLSGRSETFKINQLNIINDSYNANPESMKASIETFLDFYKGQENVLVIGEMRELGNLTHDYHNQIGEFCRQFNFKEIIVIGDNAKNIYTAYNKENSKFFSDKQSVTNYLKLFLNQNINVFFKASRGAALEDIIEGLKK